MGKFLLSIVLVTMFKSNEHIFVFGDFLPVAKHVEGAFGIASSLFGGISSGLGLGFGGQFGINTQRHPAHNSYSHYPRPQNNAEEVIEVIVEEKPNGHKYASTNPPHYGYHSDQRQPYTTQNYDYVHQTRPQHSAYADFGYENQGQQQNPTQYGHQNYNYNYPQTEKNPIQPGHQYGGNFNINGNYGNQNPDNQNLGHNPYNHNKGSNNNGRPELKPHGNDGHRVYNNNQYYQNGQTPTPAQQIYKKPEYENNNQQNENNQEYLINQVFGNNPQYNGINSGNQKPNNGNINPGSQNYSNGGFATGNQYVNNNNSDKPLEGPTNPLADKSDLPTFMPLSPVDNKRETENAKPTEDTEEEFNIDVRIKGN